MNQRHLTVSTFDALAVEYAGVIVGDLNTRTVRGHMPFDLDAALALTPVELAVFVSAAATMLGGLLTSRGGDLFGAVWEVLTPDELTGRYGHRAAILGTPARAGLRREGLA